MVSVFLLEYIDKVATREINSLTFWIISHVLSHMPGRKAGNDRAGIRIQNDQLFGIVRRDKQTMSGFVKRHSNIVFRLLPNRPRCDYCAFFPVNDAYRVFASNIDEYPRP